MEKIQNKYKILVNEKLSPQYWRMVFDAPDWPRGQARPIRAYPYR